MYPKTLFKYRADGEFTEKIIVDRQVWLATAKDLNDPFECQTGILPEDWKRKIILEKEQAQLIGVLLGPGFRPVETLFSLDRRQTKQWLKALAEAPHREKVARMRKLYRDHGIVLSDPARLFDTLEEQLASVGILSLSSAGDEQLMWAHYGGNHTGLALGFGLQEGCSLSSPRHLLEVTYADEKPVFADGYLSEFHLVADGLDGMRSGEQFSFDDPVLRASISTKPTAWSYEQEWRYVHQRAGAHPLPAPLVSATFGLRMAKNRRSHYASLLREHGHDVELLEMRQVAPGKLGVGAAKF